MKEFSPRIGPFLRTSNTSARIMLDVVIALVPAMIFGVWWNGPRALLEILVACAVCQACDMVCDKISGRDFTHGALVTGVLLAFNMTGTTPIWVIILASVFAIVVGKQVFGGLGSNIVNPALMGRCFVMLVYPTVLNSFTVAGGGVDSVTSATVLGTGAGSYSYLQMFLGTIPGTIGETSKLLLLIGFLYLVFRREVNWLASLVYVATVAGVSAMFGFDPLTSLLSGGLVLGACFMLTDYVSVGIRGQLFTAFFAGLVTTFIRVHSSLPEGVCFGILTANCLMGLFVFAQGKHVYGIKDEIGKEDGHA
ncbi:MAG: RnfABCDGE type electron transport complex subunit D [Lachnospiraceae bacterium]|nr:RnfABCDGE type electron transport complex subunit D [Lachnospiraceae bacterium]MBQ1399084.1 RnfABCDGE type electron transport complex subunit D [Lachnospiraceae bacterium]MBR2738762.1 RnfABCDGE type electron transport complex subunit D [Lachnospiraceae bacterium]